MSPERSGSVSRRCAAGREPSIPKRPASGGFESITRRTSNCSDAGSERRQRQPARNSPGAARAGRPSRMSIRALRQSLENRVRRLDTGLKRANELLRQAPPDLPDPDELEEMEEGERQRLEELLEAVTLARSADEVASRGA